MSEIPMLSRYVHASPTLVERLANDLSLSPTTQMRERVDQYLRQVESARGTLNTKTSTKSPATTEDACEFDQLLAELTELQADAEDHAARVIYVLPGPLAGDFIKSEQCSLVDI
jgi:hypothetical protein